MEGVHESLLLRRQENWANDVWATSPRSLRRATLASYGCCADSDVPRNKTRAVESAEHSQAVRRAMKWRGGAGRLGYPATARRWLAKMHARGVIHVSSSSRSVACHVPARAVACAGRACASMPGRADDWAAEPRAVIRGSARATRRVQNLRPTRRDAGLIARPTTCRAAREGRPLQPADPRVRPSRARPARRLELAIDARSSCPYTAKTRSRPRVCHGRCLRLHAHARGQQHAAASRGTLPRLTAASAAPARTPHARRTPHGTHECGACSGPRAQACARQPSRGGACRSAAHAARATAAAHARPQAQGIHLARVRRPVPGRTREPCHVCLSVAHPCRAHGIAAVAGAARTFRAAHAPVARECGRMAEPRRLRAAARLAAPPRDERRAQLPHRRATPARAARRAARLAQAAADGHARAVCVPQPRGAPLAAAPA